MWVGVLFGAPNLAPLGARRHSPAAGPPLERSVNESDDETRRRTRGTGQPRQDVHTLGLPPRPRLGLPAKENLPSWGRWTLWVRFSAEPRPYPLRTRLVTQVRLPVLVRGRTRRGERLVSTVATVRTRGEWRAPSRGEARRSSGPGRGDVDVDVGPAGSSPREGRHGRFGEHDRVARGPDSVPERPGRPPERLRGRLLERLGRVHRVGRRQRKPVEPSPPEERRRGQLQSPRPGDVGL